MQALFLKVYSLLEYEERLLIIQAHQMKNHIKLLMEQQDDKSVDDREDILGIRVSNSDFRLDL